MIMPGGEPEQLVVEAFARDVPLIPSPGASGAIAGVLGAYLLLSPKRAVRVLVARQIVNRESFDDKKQSVGRVKRRGALNRNLRGR